MKKKAVYTDAPAGIAAALDNAVRIKDFLPSPEELSAKTFRMVYGSVKSLKEGKAGSAVDFKRYRKYLKDED